MTVSMVLLIAVVVAPAVAESTVFCDSLRRTLSCPVTNELMSEPYTTKDGQTYNLETLRAWLERGHISSPLTGKPLGSLDIVPNVALAETLKVNWQLII